MKGVVIGLLAASAWAGWNTPVAAVPAALQQPLQQIQRVEQQLLQAWENLSALLQSGQATPQAIGQAVQSIQQQMQQLQSLMDQTEVVSRHLRHLPSGVGVGDPGAGGGVAGAAGTGGGTAGGTSVGGTSVGGTGVGGIAGAGGSSAGAANGAGATSGAVGVNGSTRAGSRRTAGTVQAGAVRLEAGDARVSQAVLRSAAGVVQSLSTGVVRQVTGASLKQAQVVLFSSPQTYRRALERAGVDAGEIDSIVQQTGGLTVGDTVWIPLYNLQDEADLANVLTHELTHVALNQLGIGDHLPTWVNEGTAWLAGMTAEQKVSPREASAQAAALDEQLREAASDGDLVPLAASESDILQAPYNVEWEDYRAVQALVSKDGLAAWKAFLQGIPAHGVDGSFTRVYGVSIHQYEQEFVDALQQG
ncbi:hypothetical protein [Alicyclobacillus sp.]|uniref:hypothetical protein n=1 Tax=Alicyclobacillus sp. TaxID=61169 RepID=UPI0025C6C5D3|nr:hypothetical protein [Alicyclobacillus sp.]MCL6517809.1 hypothetical protein [Alicyclobacillus sp.]